MTNEQIDWAVACEVMGWHRDALATPWRDAKGDAMASPDFSPTTHNADAFRVLADGGMDYTLSYTDRLHRLGVYHGGEDSYTEFAHPDLGQAIARGALFAIRAAITLEEFTDA